MWSITQNYRSFFPLKKKKKKNGKSEEEQDDRNLLVPILNSDKHYNIQSNVLKPGPDRTVRPEKP